MDVAALVLAAVLVVDLAGFATFAAVLRGLLPVPVVVVDALVFLDLPVVVAMVCPICCICQQTLAVLP